jgi:hypothetical protein
MRDLTTWIACPDFGRGRFGKGGTVYLTPFLNYDLLGRTGDANLCIANRGRLQRGIQGLAAVGSGCGGAGLTEIER